MLKFFDNDIFQSLGKISDISTCRISRIKQENLTIF